MADNIITQAATGSATMPYSDIELTRLINNLPTPFGQLRAEGMFPADGLASQYFQITEENNVISALPVTDGGNATTSRHETGDAKIYRVPTIEHLDNVRAEDIRGWLELADRSKSPATLADKVNKRLMRLLLKFQMTWELMRMSALKGIVVDGAGTTILNLYTAYEITQKTVYFNFSDATSKILEHCDTVHQLIAQDLSDEMMTGIRAKVSRTFFNQLIQHPNVTEFWLQAEQALALANPARSPDGGYRPRTFRFGDITFEEYSAVVPMWGGSSQPIVAAGKGHAFPDGTLDTHVTYIAPPKDIRVLDGEPASVTDAIHVTTEPMKHGKGVEMLGQMNALPFWRRPKLLVTLDAGAGTNTPPSDGEG
jgi:hypothetical protein